MEHQIGQFTAEVMKVDLSDLENPQEDCVLEDDKPQLKRIKKMAKGLEQIQAEQSYTLTMRRTQLNSILKTLTKIESDAGVQIGSMKRRKDLTKASQEIMLDELRDMEIEFTNKKASAIVIQMKAREVRERVEAALQDVVEEI